VTPAGAVLMRSRDERSTVRANRWSLPGGGAAADETPVDAAVRLVREQTSLEIDGPALQLSWRGMMSDPDAEVFLYATASEEVDLPSDPVPGAIARYRDYQLRFIEHDRILTGRSFTPVTGNLIGGFLSSRLYRALALEPGSS
jgi:8-oxo-dGTP pyrophosphatase MutT (NUDIX family)